MLSAGPDLGNAVVLAVGEGIDWTALYAMTLTVLGSVLLHGGGSAVIARSLTGPPPSAAPPAPGRSSPANRRGRTGQSPDVRRAAGRPA
ncbi:hypothetical protein [Streptomyces chartreusis]|uniref:hypothetical protein n=1 Tax=Streptomyces chartreusis TaxID=1969 RepID=UPI0002E27ED3|nr:hypothetical protein [Streptomyces chartreusis]